MTVRNTKIQYPIIIFLLIVFTVQSCSVVDLRTAYLKDNLESNGKVLETKGNELLEAAWKAQGMHNLASHSSIEFVGHDSWRSPIGKLGNPWRVNNELLQFEYAINTFDGRITILSGRYQGVFFGLQSWKYYEGNQGSLPNFEVKEDKKRAFAVPTFHYLMELPNRLMNAPIKLYAGTNTILDNDYEMVLVTWGTDSEPTKAYDQYLVYINKETHLIEIVSYSAHEGYLPGRHLLYGSIRYSSFQEVDGILIPMKHETILGKIKRKKKPIHTLEITSFQFDIVAHKTLYPNTDLDEIGDKKQ